MRLTTWRCILLALIHAVLTMIALFPSGFSYAITNTAVEEMQRFINTSYTERGWNLSKENQLWVQSGVNNIWFVGQMIGSIVCPLFFDRLGRKKTFLLSIALCITGTSFTLLAVFCLTPELLIFVGVHSSVVPYLQGRLIIALGAPVADLAVVLYIQETTPVDLRSTLSFLPAIGLAASLVVGNVMGMPQVLGSNLAHLIIASLIPLILGFIFLLFIPDTPKFQLIIKGNRDKALKSLSFFQGGNDESNEMTLGIYQKEKDADESKKKKKSSSLKQLLKKWQTRRAFAITMAVFILTIPYYSVLQSSTFFLLKAGVKKELAEMASVLLMALLGCCNAIGSLMMRSLPRRSLTLVFGFLSTASLIAYAVFESFTYHAVWLQWATFLSMAGFIIFFGTVIGPLSWFIGPELVSQRHKSTIYSSGYAITNVLVFIANGVVLPMFEVIGVTCEIMTQLIGGLIFVPVFIVPSVICLAMVYFWMPETLGKETHEIVGEMTAMRAAMKQQKVADVEQNGPKYAEFTNDDEV